MSGTYPPGHVRTVPRCEIAAMHSGPGPCYALPELIGQKNHDARNIHVRAPAYLFGIKSGKLTNDCSPGPKYNPNSKITRVGQDGTYCYSLYGRQKEMTAFLTPGPGTYKPEGSGPQASHSAPQYSFGTRARNRGTDQTPAPNNYTMPGMTGKTVQAGKRQAPCFSMTSRSKIGSFHEDLTKTPGAGTYAVVNPDSYKDRKPQYSMTSRNQMPGDSTMKPGPGAHSPEKVTINKRSPNSHSFGIRHSEYIAPMIVAVND